MANSLSALTKSLHRFSKKDGLIETPIPGVYCARNTKVDRRTKRYWHASLAIVAQGTKEIVLGRKTHRLGPATFTATPVALPVESRIAEGSHEEPFYALLVLFDQTLLVELLSELEVDSTVSTSSSQVLFSGDAGESMIEAASRLVRLFERPKEAAVLGPMVIKELFYHLLTGPEGSLIQLFLRTGNQKQKIMQAIHELSENLSAEIDVPELAKSANMSRSAFFQHFKSATAMSPIQYQKRLRLLEARRLILLEGETAESSAYKVGYKSASQFSREYSRMFGKSPGKDTKQAQR